MDPNLHSVLSPSSLDPMFSGVSLQSLLTLNPSLFADGFHTLASLTDDPPPPSPPTDTTPHNLNDDDKKLLVPKNEHPHHPNLLPIEELLPPPHHHPQPQQQPFNFFYRQPFDTFHRLPQLRSPELPSFADRKRLRHHLTPPPPPPVRAKAAPVIPQSNLARQRRQKLSEKTRCLQKLMPWDKKMDQATLLEEAYKYVKFLQAQFCVLQSMPSHSHSHTTTSPSFNNDNSSSGVFGDLERLNRSQLLQVLVNSPVAQTMLYSQGFCVFSMEQFSFLGKLSERRHHHQQMSDHASSKTFFN